MNLPSHARTARALSLAACALLAACAHAGSGASSEPARGSAREVGEEREIVRRHTGRCEQMQHSAREPLTQCHM